MPGPRAASERTMGAKDDDAYVLDERVDHERLIVQARALDRISERYMREAGIARGMRVLDLGSGMGDSALLAARLTAPDGQVLGIERSPEMVALAQARIDALGVAAIELVEDDVTNLPELGGHSFDAVVMRLILMHVPDPSAVLRDAAALVRSGGVVIAMEFDTGWIPSCPPAPLWDRTVDVVREAMTRAGVHQRMGLKLRSAFLAAGLPAPALRSEQDLGGGADWPGYDNLALVVRSMLPVIVATGAATAAELEVDTLADRLRSQLIATGGVAASPPLVGAWARVRDEVVEAAS
jgi:SAM-dependent methyltransferase